MDGDLYWFGRMLRVGKWVEEGCGFRTGGAVGDRQQRDEGLAGTADRLGSSAGRSSLHSRNGLCEGLCEGSCSCHGGEDREEEVDTHRDDVLEEGVGALLSERMYCFENWRDVV